MTMEPQPLRSVPPSCSDKSCGVGSGGGGGPRKRVEKVATVVIEGSKDTIKEGSPLRKLGVKNAEQTQLIRFGRPVLTPSQLIEFQHQSLIFKHMVDGVPVPLHLVIPIWKSVAASFGSDTGAIYRQYPSFVGFTPKEFKYRNMIDPEPGRCRRTDGKKWRCSKNVIPEQKYCERHMHRGRQQRSRKLVEASQESTKNPYYSKANSNHHLQNSSSPPSSLPLAPLPSGNSEKSKNVSTLFQLLTPSSNTSGNDNTTTSVATCNSNSKTDNAKGGTFLSNKLGTTTVSTPAATPVITRNNTSTYKNDVCSGENSLTPMKSTADIAAFTTKLFASNSMTPTIQSNYTDTPATAATTTTIVPNNKSIYSVGRKLDGGFRTINNIINRSSKISNNSNITNVSSGLGFSPKSVLQVVGCTASCFYKSELECEPWRCKRTDGKKWRCSRDILPDQKYCARHMHRGAKRRPPPSQPVFNFSNTPITTLPPRSVTPSIEAKSAMPNTNLSISLPPSPQCVTNDDKSGTSYSSDATISDTTITAYENR